MDEVRAKALDVAMQIANQTMKYADVDRVLQDAQRIEAYLKGGVSFADIVWSTPRLTQSSPAYRSPSAFGADITT